MVLKVEKNKFYFYKLSIGFIGFLLVCIQQTSLASTGSNWANPSPPWETDDAPRSVAKKDLAHKERLAPFSTGSHNVALDLGQVFLIGDLTEFNDSIGMQIDYNYGVSQLFSFDSSFGFSEHSDGRYSMAALLSGMRFNLSWYDKFAPYLVFGLGFYRPYYREFPSYSRSSEAGAYAPRANSTSSGSSSLSAILFGLHFGPGVDFELSRHLFFGAALNLHYMFGTTKTLANGSSVSLGGTYISFLLHTGVTF